MIVETAVAVVAVPVVVTVAVGLEDGPSKGWLNWCGSMEWRFGGCGDEVEEERTEDVASGPNTWK
jgi:hypothetical protein